jgi:B12-binding domain/radical SAM domain protein
LRWYLEKAEQNFILSHALLQGSRMSLLDLVLVHPPSTYRNPNSLRLHGMIAASVPTTAALELYPIGFLSIAAYLEKRGYRVGIRNVALATSIFPRLPASSLRRFIRARVVGIDLQWATNIDGALEIARLVKQSSPETPVVTGGLTASSFYRELLEHREIDFVIRGDSAEYPFLKLLETLSNRNPLQEVPNLAWRRPNGRVATNGITYVPETLDEFPIDYSLLVRSSARTLNPASALLTIPYRDWLLSPAIALVTQKGCPHDCVFCGGSATAYAALCSRHKPAVKSPAALMRDVESAARITRAPIYFVGDLRDPGETYASEVFRLYRERGFPNPLIIETLTPAHRQFFEEAVAAAPQGVRYMFTAETHDDELRANSGRVFSRFELEETIRNGLEAGLREVIVFFGIGLPGQDSTSVMRTVQYCGELLDRFSNINHPQKRLFPFISAYLPYIEPGSRAHRNPLKYGYVNSAPHFEDLAGIMLKPSWATTLAYASGSMDRKTLVSTTYSALIELNKIHEEHGLLKPRARAAEEKRLKREHESVLRGTPGPGPWLQGESSLYLPGLRGRLCGILQFRPGSILRECTRGIRDRVRHTR